MDPSTAAPIIVFGAFDRHNFGDLLFPHVLSSLLPDRSLIFAGLADRDLRPYGGHKVHLLRDLLAAWQGEPPVVLHAGGELLGCDLWEAAVMLQTPQEAQEVIKRWDDRPDERHAWAGRYLGMNSHAPYLASAQSLPQGSRILYNAVGGVDLDSKAPALRKEVLDKLCHATAVGIRDAATSRYLQQAHIACDLLPDCAALTAQLFDVPIRARAGDEPMASLLSSFPDGYIAVQFSADFGDDAMLGVMANQLGMVMEDTGFGIILFRAGAAPWHDDMEACHRLASRLPRHKVRVFESLHLRDICALIASSRAYCGSSLHGRIVAMAYGLPRLNIVQDQPPGRLSKQAAYASSWESENANRVAPVSALRDTLIHALSVPAEERKQIADHCVLAYRRGFAALCRKAGL
jgi:hypothetical protein